VNWTNYSPAAIEVAPEIKPAIHAIRSVWAEAPLAAIPIISVKSQEDIEKADLKFEEQELKKHPQRELDELTQIYILHQKLNQQYMQ
jgi:hypothetical protein